MKARILLVEDDEFIGKLVHSLLSKAGYEVVIARTLPDVYALENFDFSAVISDFQLPGADGCEVINFVRSKTPGVPALLMSGYGSWATENCTQRGVMNVHHLDKPFRSDELLHAVELLAPTVA